MKKTVLLLALALVAGFAKAQTSEINFRKGTMAEILAQAKAEKKPIFLDAYTVWCGPCKWMDKNVYTDAAVADYFNKNFVSYKLDMEKGEGIDMAKKYEVRAYPSFLFLNADGSVMHRTVGSRPAELFTEVAKLAQDPTKNFASYQKKYEDGDRSPAFMLTYLEVLNEAALDAGKEAEAYFATQNPADLLTRGNWTLIKEQVNTLESPTFQNLVKNRAGYAAKYTADSVEAKISQVYGRSMVRAAGSGEEEQYKKMKAEYENLKLKDAEKVLLQADAIYFEQKQDLPKFHAANVKLIDNYYGDNPQVLNSLAWKYYETIDDKAMLQQAEDWAKKAISLMPDYAFMDTYAALLYKLGKKEEAKAMAEKAIAEGKKAGQDVKETEALLEKISKL